MSVGCVAGVVLADGRCVVLKAQPAKRDETYLSSCREVMSHLRDGGFPCPRPIGVVVRRGGASICAEELLDGGEKANAHDAAIRAEVAGSLAGLVHLAHGFTSSPAFGGAWFTSLPDRRDWPRPHSPLFDFEATRSGAEWMDALARAAGSGRHDAVGERVVGHFDWRAEHLRFDSGNVVASYDWDSLHVDLETVLVGAIAHAHAADWSVEPPARACTIDEVRAFVLAYEDARGERFSASELRTIAHSWVYSTAYTARCQHALGTDPDPARGDVRTLLREHGERVLREGL